MIARTGSGAFSTRAATPPIITGSPSYRCSSKPQQTQARAQNTSGCFTYAVRLQHLHRARLLTVNDKSERVSFLSANLMSRFTSSRSLVPQSDDH
eukprot:scaffold516_cov401-Prasinococcus_capsulatus_cf.AAC.2